MMSGIDDMGNLTKTNKDTILYIAWIVGGEKIIGCIEFGQVIDNETWSVILRRIHDWRSGKIDK